MRNTADTWAVKPLGVLLASALAVTLLAPGLSAQTQSNSSISGRVFDPSRRPVPDIWIELRDEVDAILARTRVDASGRYGFYRLSSGTFQLRVVTFGTRFAPQTIRVDLVPVFGGSGTRSVNEQVDINLKYLKPDEGGSGPTGSGTVFAQQIPGPARKAYDEGIAILDQGKDIESGLRSLHEAVEAFPTYFLALERLGVEYVRLGRFEPAVAVLKKAVDVNPAGGDSLYALGVAHYRLKQYPESADSLRRMLSAAPTSGNASFAHYFLGLALIRNGKTAEAEPQLKRAYDMGGRNIPSDVHMALAQIYSNDKRYKDAIAELELFMKETPDARDSEKIKGIIAQLRTKAK